MSYLDEKFLHIPSIWRWTGGSDISGDFLTNDINHDDFAIWPILERDVVRISYTSKETALKMSW